MSTLLVVLVAAPLLTALAEIAVARGRAPWRAGSAVVAGAAVALAAAAGLGIAVAAGGPVALGPVEAPVLRADGLTVVLALVVSTIGLTVLTYARRALDAGPDAVRSAAAGGAVLAATLAVAAAGRVSVLVVGWVATTLAVLALLHHRTDPSRRAATARAARSLVVGDVALVVAGIVVVAVSGDLGLTRMGEAATALADRSVTLAGLPAVRAADVVAVLLVLAALARASQLPLPLWLPGTLAAPTPTSALLHAGVVNAGAIVLLRSLDLLDAAPAARWALGLASLATIGAGVAAMATRHDVKGSLATSTSAQMGFMLLAVAVGAPLAAVTHLVGHALYKSARFLGAGAAIGAAVRQARFAARAAGGAPTAVLVASAVAAVGVAAASAVALHGAEAWMLGGSLAVTAAVGCWSWLRRQTAPSAAGAVGAAAAVLVAGGAYLALAVGLERAIGGSVPELAVAPAAAPVALAAVAAVVGGLDLARRHRTLGARLVAVASSIGRLPVPVPAPSPSAASRDLALAVGTGPSS